MKDESIHSNTSEKRRAIVNTDESGIMFEWMNLKITVINATKQQAYGDQSVVQYYCRDMYMPFVIMKKP